MKNETFTGRNYKMATGDRIYIGGGVGETVSTPPEEGSVMTAEGWGEITTSHPKTAVPYWGLLADLEVGWVICDGQNGTPDLRSQFIRGASSDAQVGTTHAYTTARPRNTAFATDADSHTHYSKDWHIKSVTRGRQTADFATNMKNHNGWTNYMASGGDAGKGDAGIDFNVSSSETDETSTDSHGHSINGGGDSETAPQHIFMYWITYIG